MQRSSVPDRIVELRSWIAAGSARTWRLDHGLSLEALAREVGVHASTVLGWERAENFPRGRNDAIAYHRVLKRLAASTPAKVS